jgi:hypothetical protein
MDYALIWWDQNVISLEEWREAGSVVRGDESVDEKVICA